MITNLYMYENMTFDWESDPFIPFYTKKNRQKVEETSLYKEIWKTLLNSVYNYTRRFHNWDKYTFYIVRNFPNLTIDEIKNDIEELLEELHTIRTHENMGIDTLDFTNYVLNSFLDDLRVKRIGKIIEKKEIDVAHKPTFFICAKGMPKKEVITLLPLIPIDSQKISTPRRLRYQGTGYNQVDSPLVSHTIVYTNFYRNISVFDGRKSHYRQIPGKKFQGLRECIRGKTLVSFGYTIRRLLEIFLLNSVQELEKKYNCRIVNLKTLYKKKFHLLPNKKISRFQMTKELGLDIKKTEPLYPKGHGYNTCHTYRAIYQKIYKIKPLSNEMEDLWSIAMEYENWQKKVFPTENGDEIVIDWERTNYRPRLSIVLEPECLRRVTYPDSGQIDDPTDIHVESFSWEGLNKEKKIKLLKEKCDPILGGETRGYKEWEMKLRQAGINISENDCNWEKSYYWNMMEYGKEPMIEEYINISHYQKNGY